jgi:hypothetical protein
MSSDECSSDEAMSTDSVEVVSVERRVEDPDGLCYEVTDEKAERYIMSRSDLMDGGRNQLMILRYERRNPPTWDLACPVCYATLDSDDGCEECWCPDCDDKCRFLSAVNYGCCKHPVV